MCGICGILGPENKIAMSNMLLDLKHRGPDGSGVYYGIDCSLGHRRLSIIDLSSNGSQPMFNEDGTIAMVVNGEIYNYKDLRRELEAHGHSFKSESDSETIVHAYEEWPDDFLDHLRGMFALAIYDQNEHKLILARDPIGKKPLYYWQSGERLVFSSEIKALFAAGVPKAVNYPMLPAYLQYQYSLGTDTLFKGIKKLPAGHVMTVTPKGSEIKRYWHLTQGIWDMADDGWLNLWMLLNDSVSLRLQSDVPVGAFLSGGIDSSAVVALWRQQSSGSIHTFTAHFPTHSEGYHSRKVSAHLGTLQHDVLITPEMVAQDLDRITWHYDEPLGDAAIINNYYLAQEAKKWVTVVLAGEGGDELFGGYPWHRWAKYTPWLNRVPVELRAAGAATLDAFNMGNVAGKGYALGRMAAFPFQTNIDYLNLYPTTSMSPNNVGWLLKEDFADAGIPNPIRNGTFSDPLNRMLASDCLNLLPEKFLTKADKAAMAWGIEERLPLVDRNVMEYAFSVPVALKRDKLILRKAVEDLLPSEIVWRPKQGFGTPVAEWFKSPAFKDRVLDAFHTGPLLHEICQPKSLEALAAMATDHVFGTKKLALSPVNVLWTLFALETWYSVWFGGEA